MTQMVRKPASAPRHVGPRHVGLGAAARLEGLSPDLRGIVAAVLPAPLGDGIAALRRMEAPSADTVSEALASLLEQATSVLDALFACRLLEDVIQTAAIHAPPDSGEQLLHDYDTLITSLASQLSLGSLDAITRADGLGWMRGQMRAYRLARWPAGSREPYSHPPPADAGAPEPAAEEEDTSPPRAAVPAQRRTSSSLLSRLPCLPPPLAIVTASMALTLPVASAIIMPNVQAGWSVVVGLSALCGALTVLASPFRSSRPAEDQDESEDDDPGAYPPDGPPADSWHDDEPEELPPSPAAIAIADNLASQGVDLTGLKEPHLLVMIEETAVEIARLVEVARTSAPPAA